MKITFLGAVEEVTGSKYLVETSDTKILVDCGLFQGDKKITKRNRDPFPIDPSSVDALILTHAHLDHIGYIPALIKKGFKGTIYCSKATRALAAIILIDSGALMETYAKKTQQSNTYKPPLYTAQEAEQALSYFKVIDYDSPIALSASLKVTLIRSGHILGSAFVVVSDGKKTLTFSGDLGRPDDLIMKAPTHLTHTDYLVLESTYGNRTHEQGDPIQMLGTVVNETVKKGGVLLIPAFAVARTQLILYCLYQLKQNQEIPDIPIFLDSPMAIKVTDLYCDFIGEHKISPAICKNVFDIAKKTITMDESNRINHVQAPAIIIAGSGMADGGRMLHHFQNYIGDPKNTILFVGYQAEGTDGRALVEGAKEIEIFGASFTVRASIQEIDALSAHADMNEILQWLSYFENTPQKVFITHGELESARYLKQKIEERFGWNVEVPHYQESFDLD